MDDVHVDEGLGLIMEFLEEHKEEQRDVDYLKMMDTLKVCSQLKDSCKNAQRQCLVFVRRCGELKRDNQILRNKCRKITTLWLNEKN